MDNTVDPHNIAFLIVGGVPGFWSGQHDSFLPGPWTELSFELLGVVVALAASIIIGSIGAAFA